MKSSMNDVSQRPSLRIDFIMQTFFFFFFFTRTTQKASLRGTEGILQEGRDQLALTFKVEEGYPGWRGSRLAG